MADYKDNHFIVNKHLAPISEIMLNPMTRITFLLGTDILTMLTELTFKLTECRFLVDT